MSSPSEKPKLKLVSRREETRSEKIKKFGRKYWLPFTVGVVCVTATYVVTRRVTLQRLNVKDISIDFFNEPKKNLVEVHVPKIFNGMQGNAVYNPTTRIGWVSQEHAARAHEVSRVIMSKHLHGKLPDVKGEVLERANLRIFVETD